MQALEGTVSGYLVRFYRSVKSRIRKGFEASLERTLGSSKRYRASFEVEERRAMERLEGKAFDAEAPYTDYLRAQIRKSYRQSNSAKWWKRTYTRGEGIDLVEPHLPDDRKNVRILCLGCRDNRELDYVARKLEVDWVEGLDLFSSDPRIKVGDMHCMPFADGEFDVLIANHVLEHAYDLDIALSECARVLKTSGLLEIETPLRFPTTQTDRNDLVSVLRVLDHLPGNIRPTILAVQDADILGNKGRIVLRIHKRDGSSPILGTGGGQAEIPDHDRAVRRQPLQSVRMVVHLLWPGYMMLRSIQLSPFQGTVLQ